MSTFELSDAIAAYHTYLDHNHKLFAYLQVIAGGAAAFVWATTREREEIITVLVGFLIIAIGNARLLWLSQSNLIAIATAIQAHWQSSNAQIPPELQPLSKVYAAYRLWPVMLLHVTITIMAAVAICAAPAK